MNRTTMPFGVGAGAGQKDISPITTGTSPKHVGSMTPNGPGKAPVAGGANAPSGSRPQPQKGPGGAGPSIKTPTVGIKTVGGHTAMPGLTPTKVPGVPGKAYAPAGKMKAPGKTKKK